jgi:hypothetical protein
MSVHQKGGRTPAFVIVSFGLEPFVPAGDEFVEPALWFGIVQEGELFFFKLLEKLVPIDGSQSALTTVARKINPQQSDLFAAPFGALDRGRLTTACFDPFPDLIVIDRHIPLLPRRSTRT